MSRNRREQNVVVDFANNSGGSLRATPGRARQVRALLFSRHPERRHRKRSIRRYALLSDIPIGFRLAHPPKSLSLITNSDSNQQYTRPTSAEDNTTHSSASFLGSHDGSSTVVDLDESLDLEPPENLLGILSQIDI